MTNKEKNGVLISIIVPALNSEKTISRCLESILSQTHANIDVIVVDDGSTDETQKICSEVCSREQRVRYYYQQNSGVSAARNFGIKKAKGEYICFVDSDDYISKEFCEVLLSYAINYDAELVACGYKETSPNDKKMPTPQAKKDVVNDFNDASENVRQILTTARGFLPNKMYKTHFIRSHKIKLDTSVSMCEDLLFNIEYILCGCKAVYIDRVMYAYIVSPSSASRKINREWFTILKAYKKILNLTTDLTAKAKNCIYLDLLLSLYEAKIRCGIMHLNFCDIEKEYDVSLKEIRRLHMINIVRDEQFSTKVKIKVIGYWLFYPVMKNIKKKRMLKYQI